MKKLFKILKVTGIVLCAIITIALIFVYVYSKFGNSKIKANIEGIGTKLIAISCQSADRSENHKKFAFCINDKINMKISVDKTCDTRIIIIEKRKTFRSRRIEFYIDPNGVIELKGKANEISLDYEIVKGNKLSYQKAELRKALLHFYLEESRLWYKARELRETDWEQSTYFTEKFDSLRFNVVAPLRTKFAKEHLSYELSPRYLLESHIPKDTVIKYYELFSSKVKNSEYGQILTNIISGWRNTKIGDIAPDFSQMTFKNKNFSLIEQRGKYIILDFWGSWCGPCMTGMPKMKEYFKNYNEQIEFVGIACNDKKGNWENAIINNQLNWTQIFNDESVTDISTMYGVTGYPTKIIIDKQGKILEIFKGEGIDFYKMVDSLMITNHRYTQYSKKWRSA